MMMVCFFFFFGDDPNRTGCSVFGLKEEDEEAQLKRPVVHQVCVGPLLQKRPACFNININCALFKLGTISILSRPTIICINCIACGLIR